MPAFPSINTPADHPANVGTLPNAATVDVVVATQAPAPKSAPKEWTRRDTFIMLNQFLSFRQGRGPYIKNYQTFHCQTVISLIKEAGGPQRTVKAVQGRLDTLRKQFGILRHLREQSGFGWNPELQVVTTDEAVWEDMPKKYRVWKNVPFPYYDVSSEQRQLGEGGGDLAFEGEWESDHEGEEEEMPKKYRVWKNVPFPYYDVMMEIEEGGGGATGEGVLVILLDPLASQGDAQTPMGNVIEGEGLSPPWEWADEEDSQDMQGTPASAPTPSLRHISATDSTGSLASTPKSSDLKPSPTTSRNKRKAAAIDQEQDAVQVIIDIIQRREPNAQARARVMQESSDVVWEFLQQKAVEDVISLDDVLLLLGAAQRNPADARSIVSLSRHPGPITNDVLQMCVRSVRATGTVNTPPLITSAIITSQGS
ncbi:hypothetical protein L198_04752 [Cryptococcus wingfieldii CBS 7118]|uniref:Myb/SANT-like domain-containing protein n=1 Tax=Cryptococcus wingfieldii CBS 7118 TaxID=1295528 RepID=A0A1E3J5H1_9TREE|nr:hypothetical protein L198_04752 [Cryptococcus wingfieldii CBS 7118]ODN95356.1 hypothetical protein L198_04752 [Cryptococcus wingfieldii CBS 7118]